MKNSLIFILAHILLYPSLSSSTVEPINDISLPDQGAFLHFAAWGPKGSSGSYSNLSVCLLDKNIMFYVVLWWNFAFFFCFVFFTFIQQWTVSWQETKGGKKGEYNVTGNWARVQYLLCMLITLPLGCPNHVFSLKNLGPSAAVKAVHSILEPKHADH